MTRALRPAGVVLALAGTGIAGYLSVVRLQGEAPVCAISHGCAVVQRSDWAELAGIPVAYLGLAGYVTILALLLADREQMAFGAALAGLVGFGFSAWLTAVEVFQLHAICIWCVASAVCMTLLAAVCVARVVSPPAARTPSPRRPAGPSPAAASSAGRRP